MSFSATMMQVYAGLHTSPGIHIRHYLPHRVNGRVDFYRGSNLYHHLSSSMYELLSSLSMSEDAHNLSKPARESC